MKKLTGAFGKKKKEKIPTLVLPTKVGNETVPRKINEVDHDFLKEYAFKRRLTMLDATEHLFHKIKEEIETKSTEIINLDESMEFESEKSIRLSTEFNDYLKGLSHETKTPMKFIFSFFVEYFKRDLEDEMN